MAIVGPWAVTVYKDVNWGAVPVPTADGTAADETYTFSDAKNVGMYTACKNQGTAWDFLKFADQRGAGRPAARPTGQMPLRKDLATTYPDYFAENPSYKLFGDQAARTVEVPNGPNTVEIWQTFRDAWTEGVIFGKGDVQHVAEGRRDQGRRSSARAVVTASATPIAGPGGRRRRGPAAAAHRNPAARPASSAGTRSACSSARRTWSSCSWSSRTRWSSRSTCRSTTTSSRRRARSSTGPFVGLANFVPSLTDPAVLRSFGNVGIFLLINVPLTVVLSLVLAGAEQGVRFTAFFRVPTTCPTSRRASRSSPSGCSCSTRRPGQPGARPAGARSRRG